MMVMGLNSDAIGHWITDDEALLKFKCGSPMQDGPCQLDPDHPGRHTTVAYYCDVCGRMRRSNPVGWKVDANGEVDVAWCFMCERGLTGP